MPASGKFAVTMLEFEFAIIDVFDCNADTLVNFAIQFGTVYHLSMGHIPFLNCSY